jgi:phosphatidylserine/phosphatidylglycerophosphate/cardiolipin synthase-like enzyme
MHQKILVVDRKMVFIGSANMTTASLTMHDNLVVGLKSQSIGAFLIEKAAQTPGYLRSDVGGQEVELWLLPDPGGQALDDLTHKIRSAEKSIQIALFTFTHPVLIDEILAAHARGVQIHVVIDLHSGLGASKQAIEKMKRAGIKIAKSQGIQLLHHKFMLIDQKMLVMGSANWTKSAFRKNNDCILVLHDLNPKQKAFMIRLWKKIAAESI